MGVVSLTMGNSALPLGDGLVADGKLFRQLPLGEAQFPAAGGDEPPGLCLIHSFGPLPAAIVPCFAPKNHPRGVECVANGGGVWYNL